MSLSKDAKVNGTNKDQATIIITELEIREVEAEMAFIEENPARLLETEDVSELLDKLAGADAVAEGMESKLDNVLENLDNLLSILDSSGHLPDNTKAADDGTQHSKEEMPPSSGISRETAT